MAIILRPYPVLPDGAVKWFDWGVAVDGQFRGVDAVADSWDANSTLLFTMDVSVPLTALDDIGCGRGAELILTVRCPATCLTVSDRVPMQVTGETAYARGTLELAGEMIAERLDLEGALVAPYGDQQWLETRIISERRRQRVDLNSDTQGFPISAVSFKEEGWRPSPWRFEVYATHPADTFDQALRLFVNQDFPQAHALLEEGAVPHVRQVLEISIARQLIASVSRLAHSSTKPLQEIVEESPESIAAAADNVARRYLETSVQDACRMYRDAPEIVEHALMHQAGLFKGET